MPDKWFGILYLFDHGKNWRERKKNRTTKFVLAKVVLTLHEIYENRVYERIYEVLIY